MSEPLVIADMWVFSPGKTAIRCMNQLPPRGEAGHVYSCLHADLSVSRAVWRGNTWHSIPVTV